MLQRTEMGKCVGLLAVVDQTLQGRMGGSGCVR
jgi:hypothetical protein